MGIKVLSYDHLDPDHKALLRLEAPTAETARDFLLDAGFVHFTQMDFYLVTPVQELLKKVEKIPTIY